MPEPSSLEAIRDLPRPHTEAVSAFFNLYVPIATENIEEFKKHAKPTKLYTSTWETNLINRTLDLSYEEEEQAIRKILELCEVPIDFYTSIVQLHSHTGFDDEREIPDNFFLDKPDILTILNGLADWGVEYRDEPNDFTVGIVIKSTIGFAVIKYESQCYYFDESNPDDQLEEVMTDNIIEVCLYPLDSRKRINWHTDKYGSGA